MMKLSAIAGEKGSEQRKTAVRVLTVLAFLLAYYVFTRLTGLYIPCPVHLVTGLYCPGCGVSHFCTDLLRLDFASAVRQNAAVAVLLPVWTIFAVLRFAFPDRVGKKALTVLEIASVVLLIAFGIARNLPGLEFLRPLYAQ